MNAQLQRNLNIHSQGLYLVEQDTTRMSAIQAHKEEKEDIGFYARVPRIVRTGYKELSHAEKWLYTCLRDLCGEAGECWRSLRTLAKETGISIGSLCKMIPHLAKTGLIDAMMKGTWFIKIKDIWQANKEYCSKFEHSASTVQILNTQDEQDVQNLNATCSENEQGCSNFVTKEDISKKIESEEDTKISSSNEDDARAFSENETLLLGAEIGRVIWKLKRLNTSEDGRSVISQLEAFRAQLADTEDTSPTPTNVDDALPRYETGLLPRESPLTEWLQDISLMDDAFLAEMEQLLHRDQPSELSTPVIHTVDTESHSHSQELPTRKKAAQQSMQPAITQVTPTNPPTRETRKPAKNKNALTLAGQHILDEYQKFKGRKSTPGKATIEAANGLVGVVQSDEEFTAVLTEIRDDKFLNDHNVARDLDFVYRKYEQYRDIVEQKAAKRQPNGRPAPPPGIKDYTGMGSLLRQAQQQRGAQA